LQRVQQEMLQPLIGEVTTLYKTSLTEAAPLLDALSPTLTEVGKRWQLFVQRQIDPLLGKGNADNS